MSLSWFNQPFEITPAKTIIATRISIGIIISFIVTTYFNIVDSTWVYISLFVIVSEQKTIGASLNRASMRAIATVSSAIYSLTIIWLFNNNYLINLSGFIIGVFLYTYLFAETAKGYIATLGCITLAICLMNFNNFSNVFIRPTNVLIGILIGIFTLRFFFPLRATKMLILETQSFLSDYARLARNLANLDKLTPDLNNQFIAFESGIATYIPTFQRLLAEAAVETAGNASFIKVASEILVSFRHLSRYFASIFALIISQQISIDDDDKKTFFLIAETLTKLKDNLVHLNYRHQLIPSTDLTVTSDQKALPMLLRLITQECRGLETQINQFIKTTKTVKLS